MSRRSEVIVRPYRKGDRLFPPGIHRHVSRTASYDAATVVMERPLPRAPHRPVRRLPPLPKPRVVIHHDPPSQIIMPLLIAALGVLLVAVIVLFV